MIKGFTVELNVYTYQGEWDQSFDYFTRAWGEVVLPRLKYRFEEGPIDWEVPPLLGKRDQ